MAQVAPVPAEQLVAAVAAECDGHVFAGVPADERGRQQRAVGERLAEVVQHRLDGGENVVERQLKGVMLGAESFGDDASVSRLVVSRVVGVSDAERPDALAGAGQRRDDDG